ncbi:alpha/beta fold hydrolase [Candidatus Berkiella aquae]|uniref:Lipase family protein n=1 Tax=Candidatus Berkiella aquae TaxID=295108 RepID=A0A0Q9YZE0_9GAMM|nr:alpha/beta fold hydrolase [Candidatus Berkiella aquae]MCS5711500.1 lipase family protein [Candidatus Berkiella aquae]
MLRFSKKPLLTTLFLLSLSPAGFATPDFGPVSMGDFYASLPGVKQNAKLGEIIKSEKISTSMANVQAWKIAYISSDVLEHKTLATAIVAFSNTSALKKDRPIIAWAHGTTGTAQNCGPSQILDPAQPLNQYFLPNGNSWSDYGLPAMKAFIDAGYVIVASDYQGLGAGGKHQYAVAATQARDVINSIRAASLLPEVKVGSKAVIYGWSQGGGAVIAAAGLSDYVNQKGTAKDNIEIIGVVAMAPYDLAVTFPNKKVDATEATTYLNQLSAQFSTNIFNFTHYAQNVWGMVAAFPNLQLNDIFTDEGAKIVNEVLERKCMHAATDTFNFAYGKEYKNLLRSDIKNASAWIEAYQKSSVMPVKPMAPIIIYYGTDDTTVPPVMGKLYAEQMCQLGANITRVQLSGNQNHFTTPEKAEPLYIQWVADRFAGKEAVNGCE